MAELLVEFGRLNLALAAAILLVLALRAPLRRLAGARVAYGLWLLPPLAAAAALLPARTTEPAPVTEAAATPTDDLPIIGFDFGAVGMPEPPGLPLELPLLILWAAGFAGWLGLTVWNQQRFLREAKERGLGPAVVGVLAPRIVKPGDFEARFTSEEQRLVLAHERAHIARQDSRINALVVLLQGLCWFNPLMHAAAYFLRIDQELACDETVLSRFPHARPAYAQALLKAQLAHRPLPLGCYWPAGTEHPLFERIAMIKRDAFSRSRRLAGAGALTIACAAVGLAAWAAQPPRQAGEAGIVPVPPPTQQGFVPVGGSEALTEQQVSLPAQVNLSNAGGRLAMFPARNGAAVAAGIRSGNTRGVLLAGGTAKDVADALRTQCQGQTSYNCQALATAIPGSEMFTIGPDGLLGISAINAEQTGRFANRLPAEVSEGIPTPPDTRDNRNMLQQWLDAGIPRDSIQVTPSPDGIGQNLRIIGPAPAEALARIAPPGLPPAPPIAAAN